MANTTAILLLCTLAVVINVVSVESAHHTTAQAPTADCSTVILSMADCLSYVTNGSTVKKPEGACCSGLKTVLKSNADCLCEAFKNSAQFGVSLNVTRAMALPSACHLSAPSATNCGNGVGSGAAPVESPMAMGAGAPITAAMGPTMALGPAPALGSSGSSGLVTSALTFALSLLLSVYFSSI